MGQGTMHLYFRGHLLSDMRIGDLSKYEIIRKYVAIDMPGIKYTVQQSHCSLRQLQSVVQDCIADIEFLAD